MPSAFSLSWVISNWVINLSPEKAKVFDEIVRVLKPGGRSLISDIVVEGLPHSLRSMITLYAACAGGAISEREYLQGLRQAGLVELAVRARHEYTGAQIREWAKSLGADDPLTKAVEEFARESRIGAASLQFYGRKPA